MPIHADAVYEGAETYSLALSGGSAGTAISDGQATGTIADDEAIPTVSVADSEVTEGNAGTTSIEFTLTLTGATKFQPRIDHLTAVDTAQGDDFVQLADDSHTLFDPNGPATQTRKVVVGVLGDTEVEEDERFRFFFTGVANAQAGRASAWGTIRNDDSAAPPPPPRRHHRRRRLTATVPPPPPPPPPAPPAPPPPPPAPPAPQPPPAKPKPKPAKVTLCHRGRTIKVAKSVVRKHRRHGDKLGRCRPKRRGR